MKCILLLTVFLFSHNLYSQSPDDEREQCLKSIDEQAAKLYKSIEDKWYMDSENPKAVFLACLDHCPKYYCRRHHKQCTNQCDCINQYMMEWNAAESKFQSMRDACESKYQQGLHAQEMKAKKEEEKREEEEKKKAEEERKKEEEEEKKAKEENNKSEKENKSKSKSGEDEESDKDSKKKSVVQPAALPTKAAKAKYDADDAVSNYQGSKEQLAQSSKDAAVGVASALFLIGKMMGRDYKKNVLMDKHTWHVGFGFGIDYEYINYTATQTKNIFWLRDEDTIINNIKSSYNITNNPFAIGLYMDLPIHPYISDNFSIGFHVGGSVGFDPLLFWGGKGVAVKTGESGKIRHERNFYGKLNYGIELSMGSKIFKILLQYDHSLRYNKYIYSKLDYTGYSTFEVYNQFEFGDLVDYYIQKDTDHKWEIAYRHEQVMAGIRLFSYNNKKHKYPVLLDLGYTLNRDYDFSWKKFIWNYSGINKFHHGYKLSLWVESILKFSFDMNFQKYNYVSNNSNINTSTDKLNCNFTGSIVYNIDFFGNKGRKIKD